MTAKATSTDAPGSMRYGPAPTSWETSLRLSVFWRTPALRNVHFSSSVKPPPVGSYQTGLYLTRYDQSYFLSQSEYEQAEAHRL